MSGDKPKILLVEDDKFLVHAYKDGLERRGFEVKTANDGNQGLEALKTYTPDIMLLDLVMPDKNGFEVLTDMKINKVYKKIPVIILTNLGQQSDIEKGLSLGAVDYLIKSNFSLEEVVEKIKEHLVKIKMKKP